MTNYNPEDLFKRILSGKCVLFLGAGASKTSGAPLGKEIAEHLSKKFLKGYSGPYNLTDVCDLIMSQPGNDIIDLYKEVYSLLRSLHASDGYTLLPSFHWQAIFTTNYDRLIENSYENLERDQDLLPIYIGPEGNERMRISDPDFVHLFKLHGDATRALTEWSVGPVLTTKNFEETKVRREWMLNRIKDIYLEEGPIIFIGYSFLDGVVYKLFEDIRRTIGDDYLRWSFAILPNIQDYEKNYFTGKRIVTIDMDFDNFFIRLNKYRHTNPQIANKLKLRRVHKIIEELDFDYKNIKKYDEQFEIIDKSMFSSHSNCQSFFKGNEPSWNEINSGCDAIRIKGEEIETFVFDHFTNEDEEVKSVLITGPAGSGKTTLQKRIGYNMHFRHGIVVIMLREERKEWNYDILEDFLLKIAKRVLILIDNADIHLGKLKNLYRVLKYKRIPSTILICARTADWEQEVKKDHLSVSKRFELKDTLDKKEEMSWFIRKLEDRHYIEITTITPIEYWMGILSDTHNGNLLTFLRERAEGGGRFDEIILGEYGEITTEMAQTAYRYVCALYAYRIPIKRELLRRILSCTWGEFTEKIIKPTLEIIEEYGSPEESGKYFFRARHPIIARLIYDNVLDSPEKKKEHFLNILKEINISDEDESRILYDLMLNKSFISDLETPQNVGSVYDAAIKASYNSDLIFHRYGLYEMEEIGDLDKAEKIFERALQINKNNEAIYNSLGILYSKKAENAWEMNKNEILARNYFRKSEQFFSKQRELNKSTEYAYDPHARMLCRWSDLESVVANQKSRSETEKEQLLSRKDELLGMAFYIVEQGLEIVPPEEQNLLPELYSQLLGNIGDIESARTNYESIIKRKPDSYSSRYLWARLEYDKGDPKKGLGIINIAVEANPKDPKYTKLKALLLTKLYEQNKDVSIKDVLKTMKQALQTNDNDLPLWFKYAIYNYMNNNIQEAKIAFAKTRDLSEGHLTRFKIQLKYTPQAFNDRTQETLEGTILKIQGRRGTIKIKFNEDDIFFRSNDIQNDQNIKNGDKVIFDLGFNYIGPIALSVKKMI